MKVIVFRNYCVKNEVVYSHGDDYSEVWHNFNAIEKTYEIDSNELYELKQAISHFNSYSKTSYKMGIFVVSEDDEVKELISDYKSYLVKAKAKRDREEALHLKNKAEALAKREASKAERELKKMAKTLGISIEELKVKLETK